MQRRKDTAAAAADVAPATKKIRPKRPPSPLGWVMSLSSAMLMLYCAYVTMIEPRLGDAPPAATGSQDATHENTAEPAAEIATAVAGDVAQTDERPLFQQRYFRDSATWTLPNTWAVREDAALAKYRRAGEWGSLRPNVYFGLKEQPLGLAGSVQGSLATGLLWMRPASNLLAGGDALKLRHDTAMGELQRLEWVRHDGEQYGVQRLRDAAVVGGDLYTAFVSGAAAGAASWTQMLQTLTTDAPAPTTVPFHEEDAREWETKAHRELRPVAAVFYVAADCAEDADAARLRVCHDALRAQPTAFERVARNHFRFTGQSRTAGAFAIDFVLDAAAEDDAEWRVSLATAAALDLSAGVQQLLKELREPQAFHDTPGGRKGPQRVFVDDFGDWAAGDAEDGAAALFLAFHFALPPGRRLLVRYSTPTSDAAPASAAAIADEWMQQSYAAFQRFERRFAASIRAPPAATSDADAEAAGVFTADDREAVKVALSSLLGGQGTFMGQATVAPEIVDAVEPQRSRPALQMTPGRMTLTTATPSRTVFPRGFLWDEGFHQLVIAPWAPRLTLQTLADWLHAMYLAPHADLGADEVVGWIPREMILGPGARQRVPVEFIPQRADIANPPTFFLVLQRLLRDTLRAAPATDADAGADADADGAEDDAPHAQRLSVSELRAFLRDIHPRLHAWLQWFLFTQAGDEVGTFRWRGRSAGDAKYVPNTLSSGLDDYPRSVQPDRREKHVDLHAWMVLACDVMAQVEALLARDADADGADADGADADGADAGARPPQLGRGAYADYAAFLRTQLQRHHWVDAVALVLPPADAAANAATAADAAAAAAAAEETVTLAGYFDTGLANETAPFVLDVLCRCSDPKTRATASVFIPMAVLHEFFQAQQLRQQLQQQHQRSKSKEPPTLPPLPSLCPSSHGQFAGPLSGDGIHGLHTRERLAADTLAYGALPRIGYVALFPFLLRVVAPENDAAVAGALTLMERDARGLFLWSDHGLRSMGAVDLFYQRRNAPGDAPYWRGPIWINVNYLALAALRHYAAAPGTSPALRERCATLYRELRRAVLRTVLDNYHRTGFFWEQYDDRSGAGIRGHPFTGWTATVVNIFTENY